MASGVDDGGAVLHLFEPCSVDALSLRHQGWGLHLANPTTSHQGMNAAPPAARQVAEDLKAILDSRDEEEVMAWMNSEADVEPEVVVVSNAAARGTLLESLSKALGKPTVASEAGHWTAAALTTGHDWSRHPMVIRPPQEGGGEDKGEDVLQQMTASMSEKMTHHFVLEFDDNDDGIDVAVAPVLIGGLVDDKHAVAVLFGRVWS